MTKEELISEINYDSDISEDIVSAVLLSLRKVLMRALKDGEEVKLFNGVKFVPYLVPAEPYIDPRNGERCIKEEHYRYKCELTRHFKECIQLLE